MRIACMTIAAAMLAGCSHLPGWSVGPPYGDDLAVAHHAADPAAHERAAEPVEIDSWDDHERCVEELAGLVSGEIVRLSPIEARGWRSEAGVTHEYGCAGGTLRRRSWGTAESDHH